MMKVLWFANSSIGHEKALNKMVVGAGWIKSLQTFIEQQVELHVGFNHHESLESFVDGSTHYHPVKLKIQNFWRRHYRIRAEPESNVDAYIAIIEKVCPDVIHVHGTEAPYGLIAERTNRPLVISIQGNMTVYTHKYFSGLPRQLATTSDSVTAGLLNKNYLRIYSYFKRFRSREQRMLVNVPHVIGRTAWDRRIMSILAPAAHYHHNDEVLRPVFYQTAWKEPSRQTPFIIHTTIKNGYYKGLETIFQTAQLLHAAQVDFIWNVAGIAPDENLARIARKTLSTRRGLDHVKLMGRIGHDDLIGSLMDSHLYVNPSHIENSPNGLCEAMILGMPCISTFVGGTGSMVTDKESGLLVQEGEPWGLAGSILELFRDRNEAIRLGKNARHVALKRHDPEKIVSELLTIYEEMIQNR